MRKLVAAIDVGTGSARAGLFDAAGSLHGAARQPIRIWREPGGIAEQSSDDIWAACCAALREAMHEAGARPEDVAGLSFDATCSLVVLDREGRPLAVGPSADPQRNVILWMDHRAVAEAKEIDATRAEVLRYVGGTISPEMEMPKLLWLKRHLPRQFHVAADFFDLTDFLTWRSTGNRARSLCTVTCKWTYLAHESRWDDRFLAAIGLSELANDDHGRIGSTMAAPGAAIGDGLSVAAAAELGLLPATPVAAGLIDAHAGGVGTIGGVSLSGERNDPLRRIAYIMGTSACIMATTREPVFVPGVWGPYFSAMMPARWLNEGGQSASGSAVDHVARTHPAFAAASAAADSAGLSLLDYLERRVEARVGDLSKAALLAAGRHILPEYLGNRSPHADPQARAVMVGLAFDDSVEDLETSYIATLCGLAYGLAEAIDAIKAAGIIADAIVASGGASHSRLVRQIMADATGLPVVLPETTEPVLLGTAMLAAVVAGAYPSLPEAMTAMARDREISGATSAGMRDFHAAKRRIHDAMRQVERQARGTMTSQAT
ncbi:MAG TPA: FGGY-family carbohydrate kinase [Bauldia sp.]|nr:FGGY-family carbohydrate kinase [Bauldia sp.]